MSTTHINLIWILINFTNSLLIQDNIERTDNLELSLDKLKLSEMFIIRYKGLQFKLDGNLLKN